MSSDFCLAIHALILLYRKGTTLSSEALASSICTNPARVRKVMAKLKKAGLIQTREGSEGGYRVQGSADQVHLDQIADALDVHFVCTNWHSGRAADLDCLVASGMAELMDGVLSDLDQLCRKRLQEQTLADLSDKLPHEPLSAAVK